MLNRHQLLDRVRRIQANGESGVLRFERNAEEITVHFQQGLLQAAGTSIAQLRLGRFLAKRGFVELPGVESLLHESQRRQLPLGRAAVCRKLLDEGELEEIVREQAVQLLSHALNNEFEVRSFTESPADFFMPARLDFDRLLLELARTDLRPFKPQPAELIELRNGKNLSGLPWYPHELAVLSELGRPRTISHLAAATGLEYARLHKILGVLHALQLITVAEQPPAETTAIVRREGFPFETLTPEIQRAGLDEKLETHHNPVSFASEQFETLKVRLSEASAGRPLRVVTVSSPQAADGKTLICANLAFSCSKDPGRRVIIVDCDLRNPGLHDLLGTHLEPGLLGYLETDYLQPYCYMRRLDNLYVMTAGGRASNPVELLSGERMRMLIEYLRREFDTVVLDSPPCAPISDAQILGSLCDGLIMVVRCGRTSYGSMEKAFRNLEQDKLVGVVFNDVKPMMFNTQYDYRYYHYKYRNRYPYAARRLTHRPKTYLDK